MQLVQRLRRTFVQTVRVFKDTIHPHHDGHAHTHRNTRAPRDTHRFERTLARALKERGCELLHPAHERVRSHFEGLILETHAHIPFAMYTESVPDNICELKEEIERAYPRADFFILAIGARRALEVRDQASGEEFVLYMWNSGRNCSVLGI